MQIFPITCPSPDHYEMATYLDCLSHRFMNSIRCQGPFMCSHCGDSAYQNRQQPLVAVNVIFNTVIPFCTRVSCERAVTCMAQEDHHRRMKTAMQLVLPPSLCSIYPVWCVPAHKPPRDAVVVSSDSIVAQSVRSWTEKDTKQSVLPKGRETRSFYKEDW